MPVLPKKDPEDKKKTASTSISFPGWMLERLDALEKERNYKSRSEVVVRLVQWALEEDEREQKDAARKAAEEAEATRKKPHR